jgi:hypothetical protein
VKAAYKPVLLTALITSAVCLVHFFSAVYVPSHDEQRSLSIPTLSVLPQGVPYQPQALQSTIAQWLIPADGAANETEQANNAALANFDKTVLGDTTVALLAIYQRQQPTAVLALQRIGTPITYVQLTEGADINGIELTDINHRHIVLQHGAEQVQLQLFNPNSAVPDEKYKSVK